MDTLELKDKYLDTLFFKSKEDYVNGFDEEKLCKLLNVSVEETKNLRNYLTNKGLLEKRQTKSDTNLVLSTQGFDYCLEKREGKKFIVIKFTNGQYLQPTGRTTTDFAYYYNIIDENGVSNQKIIKVSISWILNAAWGNYDLPDLARILLQIAKDKITEKLKEGTLNDFEEIILLTNNTSNSSPYSPTNLVDANEAEYEVEVGIKTLGVQVAENKLAASIIEIRDIINAIFYDKHNQKLLLLNEERNLLDFFKSATTEEEFSHRIASLGQVSRNLNIEILRKVTGEMDSNIKSIQLLGKLLVQLGSENKNITDTLKYFGRIRQGYPIHTDIAGVIEGLTFFKINYPIENYEETWQLLLTGYLNVLKDLYKIFAEKYLSN